MLGQLFMAALQEEHHRHGHRGHRRAGSALEELINSTSLGPHSMPDASLHTVGDWFRVGLEVMGHDQGHGKGSVLSWKVVQFITQAPLPLALFWNPPSAAGDGHMENTPH